MKILVYPYTKEGLDRAFKDINFDNPYNLSSADVDFEAEPKVCELYNWVMGTKTHYSTTTEFRESFFADTIEFIPITVSCIREVPCLKAVVLIDGSIHQVEDYRCRPYNEEIK